jgi:hypothetical protein
LPTPAEQIRERSDSFASGSPVDSTWHFFLGLTLFCRFFHVPALGPGETGRVDA